MRLWNSAVVVFALVACSHTKGEVAPAPRPAENPTICSGTANEAERKLSDCEQKLKTEAGNAAIYQRRMQAYRDIAEKLHAAFTAAPLKMDVRDGFLVVELPEEILFDSGQFQLKPSGEKTLNSMADVLRQLPDREFIVAGFTDDVPVNKETKAYKDNLELSSLRAVTVVHYLLQLGLNPRSIAAAGFGKYHPIGDNSTAAGRAANRRIEVIFMPTVQEMPTLPPQ